MEEVKLNNIRIAHLFYYVNKISSPFAVKASNYGNSSITVGYLDGDKFINKNGKEFNIYNYRIIGEGIFRRAEFNKQPFDRETFASVIYKPLTNSTNSISKEKIGILLDEVEKIIYSHNQPLNADKYYDSILKKTYTKIKKH